jgi:glycosyltransferase involved in cell wall biosynthesis
LLSYIHKAEVFLLTWQKKAVALNEPMELSYKCISLRTRRAIHQFGVPRLTSPWHFPFIWLYVVAGSLKLLSLLLGNTYHLILPQDGIYTAAFATLVGKLAGKRVVCMDYGSLTLIDNASYRAEQLKSLASRNRWHQLIGSWRLSCYNLSLKFFARVSVRLVDHFLIAGNEGDVIEKMLCDGLGVPRRRLTRYAHMIDLKRFPILEAHERARLREQYGLPADALVITMICRLTPEKGINVALESLHLLLTWLAPEQRKRIRFLLVGDGPLRPAIEAMMDALDLRGVCKLWGEASREEVFQLLGLCDISLHTGTRTGAYLMSMFGSNGSGLCRRDISGTTPDSAPVCGRASDGSSHWGCTTDGTRPVDSGGKSTTQTTDGTEGQKLYYTTAQPDCVSTSLTPRKLLVRIGETPVSFLKRAIFAHFPSMIGPGSPPVKVENRVQRFARCGFEIGSQRVGYGYERGLRHLFIGNTKHLRCLLLIVEM